MTEIKSQPKNVAPKTVPPKKNPPVKKEKSSSVSQKSTYQQPPLFGELRSNSNYTINAGSITQPTGSFDTTDPLTFSIWQNENNRSDNYSAGNISASNSTFGLDTGISTAQQVVNSDSADQKDYKTAESGLNTGQEQRQNSLSDIENSAAQVNQLQEQNSLNISQSSQQISASQLELASFDKQLGGLNVNLSDINKEIDSAQYAEEAAQTEYANASEVLSQLTLSITLANDMVLNGEAQLGMAAMFRANAESAEPDRKAELLQMAQNAESAGNRKIKEGKKLADEANQQKGALQRAQNDARQKLNDVKAQKADLKSKKGALQAQITALKSQIENTKNKIQQQQAALADYQKQEYTYSRAETTTEQNRAKHFEFLALGSNLLTRLSEKQKIADKNKSNDQIA